MLPFANLSADKENEYFSDGLAEEIINALTRLPGLRVIARTSSFSFRGKEEDVRQIGATLNVEHILEGGVRKAGNRIRVTAQLVSAADGSHHWSERYDHEMTDVFAIQDEICQAIVDKLRVQLAAGQPLVKRYTENLAAYNLCLKARYYLYKYTPESLEKCREYCEEALALDPGYAPAYARIAASHWTGAFFGFRSPREAIPRVKSAALDALRLDETLAEAHSTLGLALGTCDFDWIGGERELRRALELNPASAEVHQHAAMFLQSAGRLEEALTEIRSALEHDPLSPPINTSLGYLFSVTRRYDQAIAQCRFAVELGPDFPIAHWTLGIAYLYKGQVNEAISTVEMAIGHFGRFSFFLMCLGTCYAVVGRTAEARQIVEELETRASATYVPPMHVAAIYFALGEPDQGLTWFARAVEERDLNAIFTLKSEPSYDSFRSHPAFQALLRKMNLAD